MDSELHFNHHTQPGKSQYRLAFSRESVSRERGCRNPSVPGPRECRHRFPKQPPLCDVHCLQSQRRMSLALPTHSGTMYVPTVVRPLPVAKLAGIFSAGPSIVAANTNRCLKRPMHPVSRARVGPERPIHIFLNNYPHMKMGDGAPWFFSLGASKSCESKRFGILWTHQPHSRPWSSSLGECLSWVFAVQMPAKAPPATPTQVKLRFQRLWCAVDF